MSKFLVKCFLLVVLLFFGVLIGMQEANEGLLRMKGFNDAAFQGAFDIKKNNSGEVEAAVLGEAFTAHNLEEKQKRLEEINAFHLFATLGSKLATFLTTIFQGLVKLVVITFDQLLKLIN
ncbi:YqxA family protein [Bacillus sp. Marseille-P3661]|uniref:YqxA family protein n=1 Tax=Bacillus sp. Marseille-P3661 TaxID=1936234 RepID=UPI000C851F29|nr:YqxA family protein [Bacillus sp. Marseille-P3661]